MLFNAKYLSYRRIYINCLLKFHHNRGFSYVKMFNLTHRNTENFLSFLNTTYNNLKSNVGEQYIYIIFNKQCIIKEENVLLLFKNDQILE